MISITVDQIMSHNPCYSREGLESVFDGRDSITLLECCDLPISVSDRIWGLVQFCPKEVVTSTLDVIVERAIRRVLGKSGIHTWEEWAEKWISGGDRSYIAAAYAAADADAADADAAYAAARNAAYAAARAAARAARNAAYAADAAYAAARAAAADAAEEKQQIEDFRSSISKHFNLL